MKIERLTAAGMLALSMLGCNREVQPDIYQDSVSTVWWNNSPNEQFTGWIIRRDALGEHLRITAEQPTPYRRLELKRIEKVDPNGIPFEGAIIRIESGLSPDNISLVDCGEINRLVLGPGRNLVVYATWGEDQAINLRVNSNQIPSIPCP